MFFKYPPDELLEPPPPRAVYARVDQWEPLDDTERGPFTVLLDCVEAEWLDGIAGQADHLSDEDLGEADKHISIISTCSENINGLDVEHEDHHEWFYLKFGETDGTRVADQYYNLFQDPIERKLIESCRVNTEQAATLKRLAGWSGITASTQAELENVLKVDHPVDAVAIYDVGQGAATALLSHDVPILYFDVGGSALGNWRSFPEPLKQFCTTCRPPVILSHWDWDHWSSALRDEQLLNCRWILPVQDRAGDLGAVHARFLAKLKARSNGIFWWGNDTKRVTSKDSALKVFRADGDDKDRNESGLAMLIAQNNCRVVLPADASWKSVCRPLALVSINHLMIPHHGGKTTLDCMPKLRDRSEGYLIYSYGVANMYQHPLPRTVRAFRRSWKHNAHTALRGSNGLGHIGIDLDGNRLSSSGSPCGSNGCQLEIQKWL